ncbi:mak16-a [Symbiodinium sp. CCMP2592]|nr:mak16-a [Symbiodinium sp. CCMP2592]
MLPIFRVLALLSLLPARAAGKGCEGEYSVDHCSDPAPFCKRTSYIEGCSCSGGYSAKVLRPLTSVVGGSTPWVEFDCCPNDGGWESDCGQEQEAIMAAVWVLFSSSLVGILLSTLIITCSGPRVQKKTLNDAQLETSPEVLDGRQLHDNVSMSKWCVRLDDLKQFKRLVMHAVKDGRIKPTQRDSFDPSDLRIGPSMYTVNEQYIKPVTAAAGNVSWALMKNPDGLRCDLFITHGWAEGIYEFVDKAVHCWPLGATGAYICFLSNPQNFDISHLIARPESSPFAQALKCASCMLVVSNRKASIYSRLWCVYEAFVAYKLDKPIVTARSLHPMAMTQTCRILCLYTASASIGLLLPLPAFPLVDAPSQVALAVFLLLSLGLLGSRGRRLSAIHEAIVACTAMIAGLRFAVGISFGTFGVYAVQDFLLNLSLVTALEVDRHNSLQASKQSEELRRGFTTCQSAQCSSSSDADAIWGEIHSSGLAGELESAVGALRSMNVSTRELRRTVERTGPLGDASHWNRAIVVSSFTAFWGFSPLLLFAYGHELPEVDDSNYWLVVLLIVLSVLEALAGIVLLVAVGPARRAFAARIQLFWILLLPVYMAGLTTNLVYYLVQIFVIGPVVLTLSALGPARLSRAPFIGPCFVRLVFWSSVRSWVHRVDRQRRISSGPEETLPVSIPVGRSEESQTSDYLQV